MTLSDEEQRKLVDRAKAQAPGAIAALLEEFWPRAIWVLWDDPDLRRLRMGHAAILDDAKAILLRWLAEEGSPHVRRTQSLSMLAWRILKQAAKNWTRAQAHEREALRQLRAEAHSDPLSDPREVDGRWEFDALDVLPALERLDEPHRSTLLAEVERIANDGRPSLAQRLGITTEAARKRLARARLDLETRLRRRAAAHTSDEKED